MNNSIKNILGVVKNLGLLDWCSQEKELSVSGISYNSKNTKPEDLFVCMVGYMADGHDYIENAIEKGAVAVLTQKLEVAKSLSSKYPDILFINTKDTRIGLSALSRELFEKPDETIKVIGITGTKGKTTTTYMIKRILEENNIPTGLIGTIECIIGKEHIKSQNTTPESYEIFHMLGQMVEKGIKACVMEVSSQAMKLFRCYGLEFDTVAVTNISPDHIGPNEHASFEEYVDCKKQVLLQAKRVCLHIDDEIVRNQFKHEDITYFSATQKTDVYCDKNSIKLHMDKKGFETSFDVSVNNVQGRVSTHLPGVFNVENAMCAIAVTSLYGATLDQIQKALMSVNVPGRAQNVSRGEYQLIIDYAHSGESLKALLKSLKAYPHKRTITVFGCGGNRDPKRRTEMGAVSGMYSDVTIITTDNPRYEDPMAIIEMIKDGLLDANKEAEYYIEEERKAAVRKAIEIAREGDIIIIAGKGHESTVERNGVKTEESDQGLVEEIYLEKGVLDSI